MSKPRVLLGMSGGVDSSVAAFLLQSQGYDVIGCTLDIFSNTAIPQVRSLSNQSRKAIKEAKDVCEKIGIPHIVVDGGECFEHNVIESFCQMYWNARTPNPCILCNVNVKFKLMEMTRIQHDADFIATGHYALNGSDSKSGRTWLRRAADPTKDQSYFLYRLDQTTLSHCLFPLGKLTKQDVRTLAGNAHFQNAQKPESQDICFIPNGSHVDFLISTSKAKSKSGPITDRNGNNLGTHAGLIHYTIGQRKGIGVAAAEPLYVFAKDKSSNTLIVDTNANTKVESIQLDAMNYVSTPYSDTPTDLFVKTHYRQIPQPARLEPLDEHHARIVFAKPQRACAPGQATVCYSQDGTVICGGTII